MTDGHTEDIKDARRRARAFIASVLDTQRDQTTRDWLGDELLAEHEFNGLGVLAAVSLSLLRMASPDPMQELASLPRRHFDAETRGYAEEMLSALQEDPTARSERWREAVFTGGENRGRDTARDLALIGAGAAWNVAEKDGGVTPLDVLERLAITDEQFGPP
jgi:hypothetical protein